MNIYNQISLITNFFLTPKLTAKKTGARDVSFLYVFTLLFIATISFEVSKLILYRQSKPVIAIISDSLASMIMFLIELFLFEAIVILMAAILKKKVISRKIVYFSILAFVPSILFTPLAALSTSLGTLSSSFILISFSVIVFYQLYLLFSTIKVTLEISSLRTLFLLLSPFIILFIFLLIILAKILS
ncbi:MAG: hypothetical protein A2X42_06995 [Candidatus Margulisbacteria bacterium GWF2_38_17]|nr:MAG: hypothetical protein A2X42_06995 [Candidatus Margulisbacteria bacterium GWF2_38_17]